MAGRKNKRARRRAILVGAGAIALLALGVTGVLMKAPPGVYRRTQEIGADRQAVARFNEEVMNKIGNVLLDRSGGTALELEITEEMINARLAQYVRDEAQAGKDVSPVLLDARIGFEPGRLVVATRVGRGLSNIVVAQYFRLRVDPDGRFRIEPAGTSAGLMPVPGGTVMEHVKRTLEGRLERMKAAQADEETIDFWRTVLEGLDGNPILPGKGRKRIVLDRIDIEPGVLKVLGHRADMPKETPADSPKEAPADAPKE